MAPYAWLLLVLLSFGTFHTMSAGEPFRSAVLARIPIGIRVYTGIRALISFCLLIVSVIVLFRMAEHTIAFFPPLKGIPAIIPAMFALWIAGTALRQVAKAGRLPQLFGFQEYPRLFIFSGAYTLCRHPMYSGWLIASWGLMISKPFLLTLFYNLLLTALVVLIALQEEKRMISLFGDKYAAYRKQTPFLLPYGFLKKPSWIN